MTLETPYQQYMHQSKYARWDDEKGRRETWEETVDRYMDHMNRQALVRGRGFTDSEYQELRLISILHPLRLPLPIQRSAGPPHLTSLFVCCMRVRSQTSITI
jgi:hypothetical protein